MSNIPFKIDGDGTQWCSELDVGLSLAFKEMLKRSKSVYSTNV